MGFAKHETFYIRDGWLNKGLKAIQDDPHILSQEEAPQRLGLGKNMVKSLRYWLIAFGLAETKQMGRTKGLKLSSIGELIADNDPYQELEGTLWLLHYQLIKGIRSATAWYWFFNVYVPRNFTRQDFLDQIRQWLNTEEPDAENLVAEGSLIKDFECIIHTYTPNQREYTPEDLMESPLATLNLITALDHKDEQDKRVRYYRLNSTPAINIPPLILLYTLLAYRDIYYPDAEQMSLSDAIRKPFSAGRVFNINTNTLEEVLLNLENQVPEYAVSITRTGGLNMLNLPRVEAQEVLRTFYRHHPRNVDEIRSWTYQLR